MRVIVCGSRDWEGIHAANRIHHVLDAVEVMAYQLRSPLTFVHGGCPTGADAICDRWCRRRGYEPVIFAANWAKLGNAAGPIRNSAVAISGGDMCIGFLKDNSGGTIDMMGKAKANGIPTFTVNWNEDQDLEDYLDQATQGSAWTVQSSIQGR